MKLKFDPSLDYQRRAINAVLEVFDGQPIGQSPFETSSTACDDLELSELGLGNNISLSDDQFLENVRRVQESNRIEKTPALQGREFSIEMETGTGKTYVYLRTIFELAEKYGLRKFIIVVPSVAIREGVLKSIDMTREHFLTLYDNAPFNYFVYDSRKLNNVRQFASNNKIQIMVINIQSFSKDVADKDASEMTENELKKLNIINRENEHMSFRKPIEFIQAANPLVIIDEPQSVDNTPKARRAIGKLNPVAVLRYSATHKNSYNLLYKLDPIRAYDLRLVKHIEVASVRSDDACNDASVKLLQTDNTNGIRARVEIHREKNGSVRPASLWVKQGDDLFIASGTRQMYSDGYIVRNIDCTPGAEGIEFSNGAFLELGIAMGSLNDDIMKAQISETIEQHLRKERALHNRGIKVLSLFFIDRVANYRVYHENGLTSLGKIGRWFEEAYKELSARPRHSFVRELPGAGGDIAKIHNGYFSRDRAGQWKDSTERGNRDDDDTYHLIMRDKEGLLDPNEPLRFIFSHSALREGWDNPNVFQICTLNETTSVTKKRQEIGRGLRLPVNKHGERVHDEVINRLTVVANESYKDFAQSLQKEFENDFGIHFGRIEKICFANIIRVHNGKESEIGQEESAAIWKNLHESGYINELGDIQDHFAPESDNFELNIDARYSDICPAIIDEMQRLIFKNRVRNARSKKTLTFNEQTQLSPEFAALWNKIKHRTRYRVTFDTKKLIAEAAKRIEALDDIRQARIAMTRVEVDISDVGVSADVKLDEDSYTTAPVKVLPDILAYLQKETELPRKVLAETLARSGRLPDFLKNPQQFMALTAREISIALQKLMIDGIQYEKIDNDHWEMSRIKPTAEDSIERYSHNLYEVRHRKKCLYDAIEFDSQVEKQFASDLDNNEHVCVFIKLPRWFTIDTPIGPYNPDWAFVIEKDQKLYFVRETKGTTNLNNLRLHESDKIYCGKQHFKALGVNYDVATNLSEVRY